MIDGLKLTMTGEELRARLAERARDHEERSEWYQREAKRKPGEPDENKDETKDENEDESEDENEEDDNVLVLPAHMCEYEGEFHHWRAKVLAYVRDHIEGGEVYRLGEADLEFGEVLPEKPGCVEQEEFERETRADFTMERVAREMRNLSSAGFERASRAFGADEDANASKKRNEPQ